MLFAIINTDRPASLDLRMATRTEHLAYLDSKMGTIINGGAMLDSEGKPAGSLLIVEAETIEDARALAAGDPYAKAGLFEGSVVRPFRQVYVNGGRA